MKRSCRQKVRGCALNSVEHPHGGENHQQCETVDQILASSSTRLEGQKARKLLLSSQRAARLRMWRWPRVCTTSSTSLASSPEENTQTSVQERPEVVQRRHAEDQCSVQFQHRGRNPAGLTQQTVQSTTMWMYSQDRPDRGHEQVEEGCRSTALYSSSPRNRSTSSSVCKAGALVSPSSCLDGEPHGWVPVDTHSTPVPSMTGEAVGGLCSIRAQSTTGKCATRTHQEVKNQPQNHEHAENTKKKPESPKTTIPQIPRNLNG